MKIKLNPDQIELDAEQLGEIASAKINELEKQVQNQSKIISQKTKKLNEFRQGRYLSIESTLAITTAVKDLITTLQQYNMLPDEYWDN